MLSTSFDSGESQIVESGPLHVHPKDKGLKFARILKPKRKPKRAKGTPEKTTQALVEAYLQLRGVPYIRIPDAAYQAIFAGNAEGWAKGVASAYLKGLPDLTILKDGRYLPLELKREGAKLSMKQRLWRAAIGTVTAHSFEEAQAIIDEFLNQTPKGSHV